MSTFPLAQSLRRRVAFVEKKMPDVDKRLASLAAGVLAAIKAASNQNFGAICSVSAVYLDFAVITVQDAVHVSADVEEQIKRLVNRAFPKGTSIVIAGPTTVSVECTYSVANAGRQGIVRCLGQLIADIAVIATCSFVLTRAWGEYGMYMEAWWMSTV